MVFQFYILLVLIIICSFILWIKQRERALKKNLNKSKFKKSLVNIGAVRDDDKCLSSRSSIGSHSSSGRSGTVGKVIFLNVTSITPADVKYSIFSL